MKNNREAFNEIAEQLSAFELKDQVDILANVLMFIGAGRIDSDVSVTSENVAEVIMNDRKSNGETLANALALQGLTMVLWLQNK